MRDDRDDQDDGRDRDNRRGEDDRSSRDDRRRSPNRLESDEELEERVADLEARVRDLRDELGRPPEGPLGLPRPPTPREVLSFTGEYAIPTAIAVLEANLRALDALQQVVRVLDPERSVAGEDRDRLESRAAEASRTTLDRLESTLEDVEAAVRESDLPREDEARDLLDDVRRINREIRDRVERERRTVDEARGRERDVDRETDRAEADRTDADREDTDADLDDATTIELTDEGDDEERADGRGEVDVEAELRSIKDEIENRRRGDRDADAADADDSDTDDSDADDSDADSQSGAADAEADADDSDADANVDDSDADGDDDSADGDGNDDSEDDEE